VCSLFTVGINSVARALENKELHLAIMCIPVRVSCVMG
jgi:hypothetical protein